MFFNSCHGEEKEADAADFGQDRFSPELSSQTSCSQAHRSTLILQTLEGGAICLLCFANLVSAPTSPTFHVSYALAEISRAISHPPFLRSLIDFHVHILISPLVNALSAFDDDPIASQINDLILVLCNSTDSTVYGEFIHRISDRLTSRKLFWGRRQMYMLHSLGVLLNCQMKNPYANIGDKDALVANLVAGLQLPSEEIRGEILFVLYKLSVHWFASNNDGEYDAMLSFCPNIFRYSLEVLMKTQSDDIRLNCVALLLVLAQRGYLLSVYDSNGCDMDSTEADNFIQEEDDGIYEQRSITLFAEAVKGSLLSSDSKVQIGTLDLIFHYISQVDGKEERTKVLVEENIADYVFEILRLSESKDPLINSCLQVLDLLSTAEDVFRPRLAIGFATLLPVLQYVAEIPFHPFQNQMLKLILNCVTTCPGVISASYMEELGLVLTKMFSQHTDGELSMHHESFNMACSIFVALIKSPSSLENSNLALSLQQALKDAILVCISSFNKFPCQFLHSMYLLKEAYIYSYEGNSNSSSNAELRSCVLDVCKKHLLPSLVMAANEMEEEVVLGVFETFHSILLQECNLKTMEFASILISSSWFSLAFGCLGLFPAEKMKWRVYFMLSSIVDVLLKNDSGHIIRDAVSYLPSDPVELLYLLGQKSYQNPELLLCQSSVLLILEISSVYDVRPADENLILASLEQYILVNNESLCGNSSNSNSLTQLVNLYGLYRNLTMSTHHITYSSEAQKIMFHLISVKDWDLFSTKFHVMALKWLFQQEIIIKPLSVQILKFCKCVSSGTHYMFHGTISPNIYILAFAELVATDDNFGAMIFANLLQQLVQENNQEHDIMSVLNLVGEIINITPRASDQLCLHSMGNTILNLLYHSNNFSSQSRISVLLLIFILLHTMHPEILPDGESWSVVAMKLVDNFICTDSLTQEGLFGIGILCLILHHSTKSALVDAAKAILLNSSLSSLIKNAVNSGCSKGPALADHDERTGSGEILIFVLLLHLFFLRSLHVLLPGVMEWKNFFRSSDEMRPVSLISTIPCKDLCRLMHFGSPLVKLLSSHCLLEVFTKISSQEIKSLDELNCSVEYMISVVGVLEGLIFYGDYRVGVNCGLCLSLVLSWEKLGMQKAVARTRNGWCRLIVEELAMSLAVPWLASKSFENHHKPAVHVLVALLALEKVPGWIKSVFDYPCISGIIENISPSNLTAEMVVLFRELLKSHFLKADQIANLNRILQACRKRIYSENAQESNGKKFTEKVTSAPHNSGEICEVLINLILWESPFDKTGNEKLLEEIEMFFTSISEEGSGQEIEG